MVIQCVKYHYYCGTDNEEFDYFHYECGSMVARHTVAYVVVGIMRHRAMNVIHANGRRNAVHCRINSF